MSSTLARALRRGALAAAAAALAACGTKHDAARQVAVADAPAATATPTAGAVDASLPVVEVWKSPTCGCCAKWVDHMRQSGFRVETHDTDAVDAVKDEAGVPGNARSCHTARIGGYAVEGHVPAEVIKRMLREHPQIAGLAAPGMPAGSPGMEGMTPEHYDVVAFTKDGQTSVYSKQ